MKALILNSGVGRRMGELTLASCKCMSILAEDITILDCQLQSLISAGVSEFVVTTGPFAQELEDYIIEHYGDTGFHFEHNPLYHSTNYIYSIYLAREQLDDDIILMHGDLVFEDSVLRDVIRSKRSVMVTDSTLPLPDKDFKAVIQQDRIIKIGIEFFEQAVAAQPLYKLMREDWAVWLQNIARFCESGQRGVYAENAFNALEGAVPLFPLDVQGRFCGEVDTPEDLLRVREVFADFE